MNKMAALTGTVMIALAGVGTGIYVATDSSSTAVSTITALGAPPVGVLEVGPTHIKVDYGPSQPGPFTPSLAKARSLRIAWPPSRNDAGPGGLTYTVQKNGKTINSGLVNNYITVGFTLKVRSFRICVKAVSPAGKSSPYGCTTFSGQ